MEGFAVVQQLTVRFVGIRAGRVPELVGVDRIEVGCVSWVFDFRYVWRALPAEALVEVDTHQERVVFHFVGVLAESGLLARAQLEYQILALAGKIRRVRYVKSALPIYYLEGGTKFINKKKNVFISTHII